MFFPHLVGCVAVHHYVTGTSACLGGFLITQVSISLCSAAIVPYLCKLFWCSAASIDPSHCCLGVIGRLSCCSSGFLIRPMSARASCPGPTSYVCQILLLTSFSKMFSWFWGDLCSAPFHCSHISHATFHNFFMISAIHLWLDLQDRSCFQFCSCCSLHSILNHPSQMYCFPICSCSWWRGLLLCSRSVLSGEFHIHRELISCSWMCPSVPSCFSQSSICFSDLFHNLHTCGCGHVKMCALSSTCVAQQGHCANVRNFHHCMFFPVAKCPDTHLATHCLLFIGNSCIALPVDSQSILFQIPNNNSCHFSQ